ANLWLELAWKRRGLDLASFREAGEERGHTLLAVSPPVPGLAESAASTAPRGAPIRYAAGALPAVAEAWGRIAPQMKGTAPAHGGLAVLRSESTMAIPGGAADESAEPDLLSAVLQALLEDGFAPALISENALADGRDSLDEFQLLICPETTHLRPEAHHSIVEWARKGGRLVSLGPFGLFDSLGAALADRPVLAAFNMKEPVRNPEGRWLEETKERREFEQAALGTGFVLQRLSFAPAERPALAQRAAAEAAPLRVVNADFTRVSCVAWNGAGGARYVFVVSRNLEAGADAEVSLLGRYEKPLDLLAHSAPIPVTFQRGWTTMKIHLEPGQGVVVKAEPAK
ncbi:MAG: hypothetical protein NTW86_05270, partial [Candidatus Sumerlaeota bacterium]|nr:hypothetical protein [Candidatus Sumerlaeota bacterium]